MEDEKIITGFIPQLNEDVMPEEFTAISMIRAKYEPEYYPYNINSSVESH